MIRMKKLINLVNGIIGNMNLRYDTDLEDQITLNKIEFKGN